MLETLKLKDSWTKLTRLGKFSFAKKKKHLLEFLMNKIARTNKNISEVNLIRKLFLDTNTKSFSFISSSKKAWTTYFSGKVVQSGRVGLPISLSNIFYLTLLCGELYRTKFSDMLFVLDQRLQKRISIQVFLSIAKFVDSLIQENVGSKLRIKISSPVLIVFDSFSYS